MKLIVITSPENVENEHEILIRLFESGLETLHVRKPGFSLIEFKLWISKIPANFHARLMLHSHHQLAETYVIKGLHFPEIMRKMAVKNALSNLVYSTSFHALTELQNPDPFFDYAFLSPVFDSISKQGYLAAFSEKELKNTLSTAKLPVYALGGVTVENLEKVSEMGFNGAAVLGSIWQSEDPVKAFSQLRVKSLEL